MLSVTYSPRYLFPLPLIPPVAVAIVVSVSLVFITFDLISRRLLGSLSLVIAKERLDAEAERAAAQQQRLFASMVAHEICGPASIVCGALDFLRGSAMTADQRGFTDIISTGASQILTLARHSASLLIFFFRARHQYSGSALGRAAKTAGVCCCVVMCWAGPVA